MDKLRNIFNIAYYGAIRRFRDVKTLSLMLLLPVVLIFLLGSALNSNFTPDTMDKIPVCYLNEDSGEASAGFEEFLSNEKVGEILAVKRVSSYDAGMGLVKEGEAIAFIHMEKGFTEEVAKGNKALVKIYGGQYNSFKMSVVKNMVDSFVDNANAFVVSMKLGHPVTDFRDNENIQEMPVSASGKTPRAIDYYAVTMLVMTLMYGTIYGSHAMAEDKVNRTETRLKLSPVKPSELVMGKILGTVVTILLQAIILLAFTKYVYRVNWGSNIPLIFFICFSVVVLAVGIGIMAYAVFRSARKAAIFLSVFVSVMTFVSGGYFPISIINKQFLKLSMLSPNYLAQKAIFNTVFSGPYTETANFILAIWGLSLLTFILSMVFSRRAVK